MEQKIEEQKKVVISLTKAIAYKGAQLVQMRQDYDQLLMQRRRQESELLQMEDLYRQQNAGKFDNTNEAQKTQ